MSITHEIIWQAADQLSQAGESPTLSAVRKTLGRGSYSTLSEAMREWHQRQAIATSGEPLPSDVAKQSTAYAQALWAMAMKFAREELNADRKALEQQRAQLEAARDEVAEAADQASREADALRAELEKREAVHRSLELHAQDAERRLNEAGLEHERMIGELNSLREQVTRQEQTLRTFAKAAPRRNAAS